MSNARDYELKSLGEMVVSYKGDRNQLKEIEHRINIFTDELNRTYRLNDDHRTTYTPLDMALQKGLLDVVVLLVKYSVVMPNQILTTAIDNLITAIKANKNAESILNYRTIINYLIIRGKGNDRDENAQILHKILSQDTRTKEITTEYLHTFMRILELPINWDSLNKSDGSSLAQTTLFFHPGLMPMILESGADIKQVLIGPRIRVAQELDRISHQIQVYIELAVAAQQREMLIAALRNSSSPIHSKKTSHPSLDNSNLYGVNSQTKPKYFHIGDILSVVTGRSLSPKDTKGVYKILNFMTNDSLHSHQLTSAVDECKLFILAQYPSLADVNVENVNEENKDSWLQEQIQRFGKYLAINKIPLHAQQPSDSEVEVKKISSW